jgi:uncharacterized protein (DUF2164 family)
MLAGASSKELLMAVRLSEDATKEAIASIRRYCGEHLEVEIGDLQAGSLLGYFLKELAPSVYNATTPSHGARYC